MKSTAEARNPTAGRILVVEDNREMARFLEQILSEEGYAVDLAPDGPAALERVSQSHFDLIISDLMMPRMKGTDLIRQLKENHSEVPVLVITAFGTIESAVEAMKAGALHYITKPFRTDDFLIHVQSALENLRLHNELNRLRTEVHGRYRFENLIGHSDKMQKVFDVVARVSDLPANVLILGESGTGKEMIARAIHLHGPRAQAPFIAVNCAAIPETLLESELFGYVRGAFTDARRDRIGLFQEASGGVLFLDEISELSLALQAKLLRILEDKEVRPLGSNKTIKVDVQLLSASNRDLAQLIQEGAFRQDLYYRLNVIRLELPPLRDRPEDIPLLSDHFLEKFAKTSKRPVSGIDKDALTALMRYHWPGNVRELEHVLERAVLLGNRSMIGLEDLPASCVSVDAQNAPLNAAMTKAYTLRELEREYIQRVVEDVKGNKTEAAKILGVDRTTLYRKLEDYKIKA
ncbi:MAG TPA: sigma-54 dependent transcriptional regulator [Candidatus Binatia bacterium]